MASRTSTKHALRDATVEDVLEYLLAKEVVSSAATAFAISDHDLTKILKSMEADFSSLGLPVRFDGQGDLSGSSVIYAALQGLRADNIFKSEWKQLYGYTSVLGKGMAEHIIATLSSALDGTALKKMDKMSGKMHAALEGAVTTTPILRADVYLGRR
ncbi:hypothetical protein M1589_04920 [Candidatus Marsarchaeota archaeon]|jgi:hypothetical protein|nr:hypothetical protein [Candidatus Marsarchaeota archaeon]MCL5115453.1 hypothetical protein [Candidatus Marsarchaeota archaeon]